MVIVLVDVDVEVGTLHGLDVFLCLIFSLNKKLKVKTCDELLLSQILIHRKRRRKKCTTRSRKRIEDI